MTVEDPQGDLEKVWGSLAVGSADSLDSKGGEHKQHLTAQGDLRPQQGTYNDTDNFQYCCSTPDGVTQKNCYINTSVQKGDFWGPLKSAQPVLSCRDKKCSTVAMETEVYSNLTSDAHQLDCLQMLSLKKSSEKSKLDHCFVFRTIFWFFGPILIFSTFSCSSLSLTSNVTIREDQNFLIQAETNKLVLCKKKLFLQLIRVLLEISHVLTSYANVKLCDYVYRAKNKSFYVWFVFNIPYMTSMTLQV